MANDKDELRVTKEVKVKKYTKEQIKSERVKMVYGELILWK